MRDTTCEHDPVDQLLFTANDVFVKAAYPAMTHIQVTVKGGQGGAASDGTRGLPGESASVTVLAADVADVTPVQIGAGGVSAPGQPPSEAGHMLIAVYECGCLKAS